MENNEMKQSLVNPRSEANHPYFPLLMPLENFVAELRGGAQEALHSLCSSNLKWIFSCNIDLLVVITSPLDLLFFMT